MLKSGSTAALASLLVALYGCDGGAPQAAAPAAPADASGAGASSMPAAATAKPDAHSGPAFSTLVGLAYLAGSGSSDIRDIALGTVVTRKPPTGMMGRLLAAMRGGY